MHREAAPCRRSQRPPRGSPIDRTWLALSAIWGMPQNDMSEEHMVKHMVKDVVSKNPG